MEADRKLLRETIENVKSDPLGVARIWAKKPVLVWLLSDASLYPESPRKTQDWRLATLIIQHAVWAASLLLAVYGFFRRRDHPIARLLVGTLAVSTLVLLPVNPERRYAVPLYPAVYVLAGAGFAAVLAREPRRLMQLTSPNRGEVVEGAPVEGPHSR